MAETTFTYSIASDTANAKVNSPKLIEAVEASSITVALNRIDTDGDDLKVVFDSSLSSGEETTLGGLIAVHDGEPIPVDETPQTVKIDSTTPVHSFALTEGNSLRARLIGIFNQTITKNGTRTLDWEIPQLSYQGTDKQAYMDGINYYAKDAEVGDHMVFQVIDIDNVLGYGANTVLDEFGHEWAVMPDSGVDIRLYKAKLIAGLYIRIMYESTGNTNDVKFVCNLYRHMDTDVNV